VSRSAREEFTKALHEEAAVVWEDRWGIAATLTICFGMAILLAAVLVFAALGVMAAFS
jgi:hypothetical protein